jgi:hypothetical protein
MRATAGAGGAGRCRRRATATSSSVAELVAEGVVDLGKVVEVDQAQRGVGAHAGGGPARRGVEDQFDQAGAVRQAGQLVVEGGVVQVGHQFDVVEADRDVRGEHRQQAAAQRIERPLQRIQAAKSRPALPPK